MIKNRNQNYRLWTASILLGVGLCAFSAVVNAAEEAQPEETPSAYEFSGSVTPEPLQYAYVEGDRHTFRQHHWTKEGYDGGFEEFELEEKNASENIRAAVDGHAMVRNNDYEVNAIVEKKDFGFLKLEYQEFIKYYDDMGGVYYPFRVLDVSTLGRELALEIGHIRVEAGLTVEEMPKINVAYERSWKDGAKSRLTWTPVTVGSLTREIGPSYQQIDEVVDSVELNESHTVKGVELAGQQLFEWSSSEMAREERSLASGSTASAEKIRVQTQDPQYHLFSTTESAQRWFKDETVFAGTAYHFMRMENSEVENIFEMNKEGAVKNFSNPKQIRNARADNEYNDHAWTGNVMVTPLKWMSVDTKIRTGLTDRSGNSAYPSDTTPVAAGGANPDGIINNTDLSRTEDRVARIGEGISFRINGIPRTALYNDFEFEQMRNWLSEDRDSLAGQSAANAGEIFGRETLVYLSRGIWTLGGQVVPCRWFNWTSHFRINRSNSDYDDKRETDGTATGAKSAFMDAMNIQTQELATRFTFKVRPWLKPSVRYQHQLRDYETRVENLNSVGTRMDSHIFTFDVTLQPLHNLLIMTGVSPQYASVVTPARDSVINNTPRFQANVLTWLLNVNYDVNERVGILGGMDYTQADNFFDSADSGLPLGAAFHQSSVSAGVNWKISKMVSLITGYDWMRYNGRDQVDATNYFGHMFSIKTRVSWD